MKITNSISKKRHSLRRKLARHFTQLTVWFLNHTKANIGIIRELREQYEYSRDPLVSVAIPPDTELSLLAISLSELIPVENIAAFHRGIKLLVRKYRPRSFLAYNDLNTIDEAFIDAQETLVPGRWSKIGIIEFPEQSQLREYVWNCELELTHFSSSLALINFTIKPSERFSEELRKIIDGDEIGEFLFHPKVRSFLHSWGSSRYSPVLSKQERLQDALLELKWRFLKELTKFVPLYFYPQETIGPSIEVYKLHEKSCHLRGAGSFNDFWASMGMERQNSFYCDMTLDGLYYLFSEQFSRSTNPAAKVMKVVANDHQVVKPGLATIEHQIDHATRGLRRNLMPFMLTHAMCDHASLKLAEHRTLLYRTVGKNRVRFGSVVKLRLNLEQEFQILSRLVGEFSKGSMKHARNFLNQGLADIKSIGRQGDSIWPLKIVDYSELRIKEVSENLQRTSKMVDDRMALFTVKSSYRIQFWTLVLGFFTLILTGLAVYLTWMTLTR